MPAANGPIRVRVKAKPKPTPKVNPQVFGPVGQNTIPGQAQAKAKVQRATKKVERNVVAPAIPKLKHPTSAQRGAAQSLVAGSLRKQGITTTQQVKALPKAQRVRVNRAKGYATTNAKRANAAGALVRGVSGPYTEKELARIGRLADAQTRAQVLPGPKHSKVGIGPASIDLTNLASSKIVKNIESSQVPAFLHAGKQLLGGMTTAGEKLVHGNGLLAHGAQDAIDLPGNIVTSTYYLAKHPVKGLEATGKTIGHTLVHPVHDFKAHPLNTLLILRGVKSAIGHPIGATMRALPSETTKRLASTERTARTIPGTDIVYQRHFSGDPSTKVTQAAIDKAHNRVAKTATGKRFGVQEVTKVRASDLHRMAHADAGARRNVAAADSATITKKAKQALNYKRRKTTAAVNTASQAVTNFSAKDLRGYLDHVSSKEIQDELAAIGSKELTSRNRETRRLLTKALANHDPAAVKTAAEKYTALMGDLERQVNELHMVNERTAESTRLVGPAMRLKGHTQERYTEANKAAGETRASALKVKRSAKADVVKADRRLETARANARVSVARSKKSPALVEAVKVRDQAVRDLAQLRRVESKAKGRAEVLSRNVGGKGGGYGVELAQRDIHAARENVRAAEARVQVEQAKVRGVAPKEAEALRKALGAREDATTARKAATAQASEAETQHRALGGKKPSKAKKAAPFVDEQGNPVYTQDVRDAMAQHGTVREPAYVSHQPIPPRQAALPTGRVRVKVKEQRTGEGVRLGTLDVHPLKLIEQAQHTQALISAAKAHDAMIKEFRYKDAPPFKTAGAAENFARENGIEGKTGHNFQPVQAQDGSYHLLPSEYIKRLDTIEKGTNVAPLAKGITSRWRRVVLAFSPRWLAGNTFEAAVRAIIAGAGPLSFATAHKAMKHLDPEQLAEVKARATPGGQYTATQRLASERVYAHDVSAMGLATHELMKATRADKAAHELGSVYGGYTRIVFHTVNGNIESFFQKAMLGKAMRKHPTLMSEHVIGLSEKAVREAAQGLTDTPTMRALGIEVKRMYGQYDSFPPKVAGMVANYTPFLAWTWNAVNFLYHVLPADHPIITGLAASASQTSLKWRKQHGLYMDILGGTAGQLPPFLQGSIPGAHASHLRLSRYTPFGVLENEGNNPFGGLGDLVLPQFSEILKNCGGKDWKDTSLTKNKDGARALAAGVVSFIEGQIPLLSQGAAIAGVRTPNMADTTKMTHGVGNRAVEQFYPLHFTPAKKNQTTKVTDPWAVPSSSGGSGWDAPTKASPGDGWG